MEKILFWLVQNKWTLLFVLEILAWGSTFAFFYSRYWLESSLWSKISGWLLIATGFAPQIGLALINTVHTRRMDLFEVAVILLVIYSITIGKRHIQALDERMKEWAQKRKRKNNEKGL